MVIDIGLWDREEGRYLEWLERVPFFINCFTNDVYKFDKRTYYCGGPFTNVSDRYEVRPKEDHNEM